MWARHSKRTTGCAHHCEDWNRLRRSRQLRSFTCSGPANEKPQECKRLGQMLGVGWGGVDVLGREDFPLDTEMLKNDL